MKRFPADWVPVWHLGVARHQEAGFLECFAYGCQGEGTRLAARLDAQETFLLGVQFAIGDGLAILWVHTATGEDVFVWHEGMTRRALTHQDARFGGVPADQYECGGVFRAGTAFASLDDIAIIFLVKCGAHQRI